MPLEITISRPSDAVSTKRRSTPVVVLLAMIFSSINALSAFNRITNASISPAPSKSPVVVPFKSNVDGASAVCTIGEVPVRTTVVPPL